MDYLNQKATFTCPCGYKGEVIFPGTSKVIGGGELLLNSDAKIQIMPPIPIPICKHELMPLTPAGSKPPCPTPVLPLGTWLNSEEKNKANGGALLTENSYCMCQFGPVRVSNTGVNGKVVKESAAAVKIPEIKIEEKKVEHRESDKSNSKEIQAGAAMAGSAAVLENAKSPSEAAAVAEVVPPQKLKKLKKQHSDLLCPYDPDNEKCQQCQYPTANTEVDNDSIQLRNNYNDISESKKISVDTHYDKIFAEFGRKNWSYAAHHIISGNQVFKPFPEIVRMANFCGYDINNAENCIMLLTKLSQTDEDWGDIKKVSAFKAMSMGRIQWHLGGHSYQFSEDELKTIKKQVKIYRKQEAGEIKSYATLVKEELAKMNAALSSNKVCRNSPQQKAGFIRRMNNLSAKVKAMLGKFTEYPHRSYPYYVSKEAYIFAFNVPRTNKIMVVDMQDEKLFLEKYRAQRFEDTMEERGKSLAFNQIKGETGRSFVGDKIDADDIIQYAENIQYFVILSAEAGAKLQKIFELYYTLDMTAEWQGSKSRYKDYMEFLQHCDTEIAVYLRDNPTEYVAPLRMIQERRKMYSEVL